MTAQDLKRKLVDRIGNELLKKNIASEDFLNFAQAICILIDCEMYEKEIYAHTQQESNEFNLDEFWKGLLNPKKKD